MMLHAIALLLTAAAANPELSAVFESTGDAPYRVYRIPAVVQTKAGTLLAFAEGRPGLSDAGQIDLVLRRSTDGGRTWLPMQVVAAAPGFTTGNPAPVADAASGTVWLLLTRNRAEDAEHKIQRGEAPPRTAWVSHSADDGLTWSPPVELPGARKPEWRWYATGPGHGVQLSSGRLMIPCNHSTGHAWADNRSHALYSDDAGKTWQIGGIQTGYTNESSIAELADGRLYRNMRNYRRTARRAIAHSSDGGLTWTEAADDPALIDPVCQATVLRYSVAGPDGTGRNRLLFANPASEKKRENMTLRLSYDEGAAWPVARTLWPGPAAYSDLVALRDGAIGLLFEQGLEGPYELITFARIPLGWLEAGAAAAP